ncbi:15 kDa protein B-like isoform X1 [Choloepus didactylus]|uniref:15 kDa protein B-like isoform X1 n=1 Tax=Choloepus didactylus TaxID=27675 RepID=UPI00189D0E6A|nr:15 kDa protein B-like isoform X1 [Choloepus didactylus]
MAGAWRALLVVGLAVMARVVHCQLSYETIAALAEQYFNQERRGQTLFRLLEAIPPPHWNSNSTIPLKFRIKETVCLWSQLSQLQECAFREGGEKKNCTGSFSRLPHFRLELLGCVTDPPRARGPRHSALS